MRAIVIPRTILCNPGAVLLMVLCRSCLSFWFVFVLVFVLVFVSGLVLGFILGFIFGVYFGVWFLLSHDQLTQ